MEPLRTKQALPSGKSWRFHADVGNASPPGLTPDLVLRRTAPMTEIGSVENAGA